CFSVTPKGSGAGDPTVGAFGRAAARPKAYRILYNISYARCRQAVEGVGDRYCMFPLIVSD
ncbi:hypothetical protein M8037_32360, partial [Sinorhizobium meliloti]|uniref:hypothetical protein n=1 Tax=Rhizobium meliloti TaxID=382 RepID=UPI002072E6E3